MREDTGSEGEPHQNDRWKIGLAPAFHAASAWDINAQGFPGDAASAVALNPALGTSGLSGRLEAAGKDYLFRSA